MKARIVIRHARAWTVLSWTVLAACKRTSAEPAPTDAAVPPASFTATSSSPTSTSAASAQPSASAPLRPLREGVQVAAGKGAPLGATGATFTPSFKGELSEAGTGWRFEGAGASTPSLYLLRKEYEPGSALGALPCKETMKREADGVVRRCKDETGTWFSRDVAIDDKRYKTLQCMGDSKNAARIAAIEAACRSIRRTKPD